MTCQRANLDFAAKKVKSGSPSRLATRFRTLDYMMMKCCNLANSQVLLLILISREGLGDFVIVIWVKRSHLGKPHAPLDVEEQQCSCKSLIIRLSNFCNNCKISRKNLYLSAKKEREETQQETQCRTTRPVCFCERKPRRLLQCRVVVVSPSV